MDETNRADRLDAMAETGALLSRTAGQQRLNIIYLDPSPAHILAGQVATWRAVVRHWGMRRNWAG